MENVNIFGIELNYIKFRKIKLITKITCIYTSNYKQNTSLNQQNSFIFSLTKKIIFFSLFEKFCFFNNSESLS